MLGLRSLLALILLTLLAGGSAVPGDVDDAHCIPGVEFEMGETEVHRDSSALFFGMRIAIDVSQGLGQQGLAVIDVTGGSHDQV